MNKTNKNMFLYVFPTNTPAPGPGPLYLCLSEQLPCCFQSWPLDGARRYRSHRSCSYGPWNSQKKRGCLGFVSKFTRFQTLETVLIIWTFICYIKSCSKTPKALHFKSPSRKSSDVYKAESQVLERMTFKLMSVIHCQAKMEDYLKTIFRFSFTNNIMMNSRWKCRNSIVIKHHLRPLVISFELALHVMTVWIYNCQRHLSFSTTNASVLWYLLLMVWMDDVKNMSYSCNRSLILSRKMDFFIGKDMGITF